MKMIAYALLFLVAERAIPYCVWGVAARISPWSEREYIKRYGLISFPRTYLGVLMVLCGGIDDVLSGAPYVAGTALVVSMVSYILFLSADVWRAWRP